MVAEQRRPPGTGTPAGWRTSSQAKRFIVLYSGHYFRFRDFAFLTPFDLFLEDFLVRFLAGGLDVALVPARVPPLNLPTR